MEKRILGKTGFEVSILGFGSAPAAFLKADAVVSTKLVHSLLDSGINLVDTATMYPGSHEFIGEYLSPRRNEFVLVSKVGQKMAGCSAAAWSGELIAHAIDQALLRMKTDHVDVMLLHSCDLSTLQNGEALGAMIKARDQGKINYVGYSGDNDAAAYAATLPDIAVIETSINIADQHNIDLVLPTAIKNNVGIIVKRPIANACWKDINSQLGLYKTYAAEYTKRFTAMGLTLDELGLEGDPAQVWPQVALRFTLFQQGVTSAIVGTTSPDNASRNILTATQGPLPAHIVARIRAAFRKANSEGTWLGQQ